MTNPDDPPSTLSRPSTSETASSQAPSSQPQSSQPPKVALLTLGCARNEVDSDELAGRLGAEGYQLVEDPGDADAVMVNTCGFVDAAKKDSIDTLLAAAELKEEGTPQAVIAVGCMAERYGADLANSLPEADAVLGFDDYADIGQRVQQVLSGEQIHPHTPSDRRKLLPVSPADRQATDAFQPGHGQRQLLNQGPMAPLKLASGCDRRCSFCAIPMFRGSFVSRRPNDVVAEARWLTTFDVKELFLVSENSTSYGKDLGDLRLLEALLPELAQVPGVERVRVSYLQPAEVRPSLIEVIADTPGVVPYFDLSMQHAHADTLRRMRRFGDPDQFLGLLERIRTIRPEAGIRSNFIVGFPGEREAEFETLCDFVSEARLDAIGVFGYSDEDGTEAISFGEKVAEDEIAERVEMLSRIVDQVTAQRAQERVGERVEVLVEAIDGDVAEGRAAHQGPESDGATYLPAQGLAVGDIVAAQVVSSEGVDLTATVTS